MATNKHLETFNQKHIKTGESVIAWGEGYIGEMMGKGKDTQHNGILLVTGDRVVFYRKGFFGEVIESMPLKSITSIERKSMLGHHTVRLHTSHDELSFKTFKKSEEEALIQAIEAGRASNIPPQATARSPDLEAIRQLGELRASGVLTEDEFQSKKNELLSRL